MLYIIYVQRVYRDGMYASNCPKNNTRLDMNIPGYRHVVPKKRLNNALYTRSSKFTLLAQILSVSEE